MISEVQVTAMGFEPTTTQFVNEHSTTETDETAGSCPVAVIIISVSSDPLNLKTVEKKGKNFENERSFLEEIKNIFGNF